MVFKPAFEVEEFSMLGIKLAAPPSSFIASYGRNKITYETHVCDHLLAALTSDSVLVDIGANVGIYTLAGAKKVGPNGRVVAIEADQINAQCILYGAEINKFSNIEVWPVAASNKLKAEALLVNGSTNSGTRTLSMVTEETYSLCLGIPVDYILKDFSRVDVIKIDIEAREHPAMIGCAKTLERFKPKVFSEFTPHAMKAVGGHEPDEYLDFFFTLGYEVSVLHLSGNIISCGTDKKIIYDILRGQEYDLFKYLDLLFSPKQ